MLECVSWLQGRVDGGKLQAEETNINQNDIGRAGPAPELGEVISSDFFL